MDNSNERRYTYLDSGFNSFLRRSIDSNPQISTLRSTVATNNRNLNFDHMQVSGSLGGIIQADGVQIGQHKVAIVDDSGVEIGRFGSLDD